MEQSLSTTPLLPLDKSTAHSVEIVREEGENGELESFGFTIKNGRPPVISSIVPGGPADRVGLKSNNVILSVNGEPVDYLSHQTVADLIYKSPSSSVWLMVSDSPEESVHHTSALHSYSPKMSHRYSANSSTARSKSQQRYAASVFARRSPSSVSRGVCKKIDVFLHYLGPIEMPYRWVARGVSLKCIRECVKKMLVTRRQHLAVVLEIAADEMSLLSTQNKKLISYSRDELYYCGVHMEDERYFGIVTRHQKMMVDPQVGQTVSDKEGEETSYWVNHCHVFQVVPGQSSITMTFQQVSSPLKRETTTPVRSANTIVNYIRQMYGSGNHHSTDNGALANHTPPVAKPTPIQHVIPNIAKVSSGSSISSSAESSPNVQRRHKDLVDLRPPAEGPEAINSPVLVDSPYSPSTFSFSGSSQHDDHDSQPSSVRGETGLESIESEPNLPPQTVVTEVEEPKVNGIHDDFVRNGLPPRNSKISGSLDSVMTSTTTADNTFDNAPQVGSWVASFDKLLQDPAGVQCFQQFLLGEFSEENIKFWLEIEKFRVKHPHQLKPAAKRIYSVYISPDAKQPVNLDGSTVKSIQDRLESPNAATFNEAQKQIYNLMRLDSYQRFKRSSLLQKCLLAEMDSQPLPISLPQDADQDTSEDRDKVTPLQPVKVTEEKQQTKKSGRDGWSLFNRRTSSFRNNTKQKSTFGSYFTQEKRSSKVVRDKSKGDKSKGSGIARVEPEPRVQEAFKGFQGHEEEDHLDLFNDKYGPCFGIVIQEKVSKILPVPSSGTVQDALHSVVVKQNKMSFGTLDIRYADTMQLVDLEDPASVLNRHYIVVKQSLDFFHAIFPGKEVPVPADQNKTVLEVMRPILADNSLDESMVAFYMYGARQPLSNTTYAGLLKGRKIHVKLVPKAGVSSSLTRNSLGTRGSNHSLHSSSSSLNQKSDTLSNVSANNNNNNNNNSSRNADKDDLFDMIMRLQSDTLDEQRSKPVSRPLSSSVSTFVIKESKNERERTPSDPPSSPKKSQSIVKPIKRMFRTLSGSEPSLNKVELVGRRSLSPAPEMSLSQDVIDDVPKFTVEVVSQFHPSRRRSYVSPPTASPPVRDPQSHVRSVSPPPTHPRYPSPPQYKKYSSTARPVSPTVQPQMGTRSKSPIPTQSVDEFRVRAGSIPSRMAAGWRETTPTSGYHSKSLTPDSLVDRSNTSSLDHVILTANTHHLRRDRRSSKESSSSSDGTYVSFHQNSSRYRPHRPLHQYNSEPGFSLSQPQDTVQNWPPAYRSPVHSGATDEERKLLAKGEHLLEKEFQEYQSSMTQPSLSQPTHDYPLQRGHPSRKRIPKQSSKQWNKAGSMV